MTRSTTKRRSATLAAGCVAAVAGTLAAAAVAVAPASANVSGPVNLSPGFAGRYGVGCTYIISVTADIGGPVLFREQGIPFASVPVVNGTATTTWAPTASGLRTLSARQGATPPVTRTVNVGTGINLGFFCPVF
ncbi:hypothetical protein [Gordonia westfalica]|uniref:Uncharacterized protein n=1 Tax=Gordonia westfalica TaxID=158898 RepID=A0A1H2KRZ8_9ACTN|nr:hypothetical protein [Gordonia westfalica]SDU71460.1 hypothetical protein SAMN04488548_1343612 [Gordonia westfalica]